MTSAPRRAAKLVRLAKKNGVALRQSYERVGKRALIAHQRYAHAKQFKRANRALKSLRTYLGRVIRDIWRKIAGEEGQQAVFAQLLSLAHSVRHQHHLICAESFRKELLVRLKAPSLQASFPF
jgi:transposase, IS5 family